MTEQAANRPHGRVRCRRHVVGELLRLLLAQGLLLALTGALLGWLLGHAAVGLLGLLESMQDLDLQAWRIAPDEAWLPVIAVAVGLLAAALPALRAYRTDIAATLARV